MSTTTVTIERDGYYVEIDDVCYVFNLHVEVERGDKELKITHIEISGVGGKKLDYEVLQKMKDKVTDELYKMWNEGTFA